MAFVLMSRFDIYNNPGNNRARIPYLVDVQSNALIGLATRIVIPLRTLTGFKRESFPSDLFPIITIDGNEYFLDTPQLGAFPSARLRNEMISATADQFSIQAALDRVFGAY
jgi:toxin CcdB